MLKLKEVVIKTMIVISPEEIKETNIDSLAARVFLKALEILGGPRKLVEYRNLTWLPSLMAASYTVVLFNEAGKTENEIAEFLGITKNTVRNILRATPEVVKQRLEEGFKEKSESARVHMAGGIAKLAYQEIKEGRDYLEVFAEYLKDLFQKSEAFETQWPMEVLLRIKGTDFPVKKAEILKEKLSGMKIEERKAEEIIEKIDYPIENPADLLHKIKEVLKR